MAELRVLTGDHQITDRQQLAAAGQADALHLGNDRLREFPQLHPVIDETEDVLAVAVEIDLAVEVRRVLADQPVRFVEVVTDRERAAAGRSEGHTSELQSLMRTSYAVFC